VYDKNVDAYYFKSEQTCPNGQEWLYYDPTAGYDGYFVLTTQANRSAFKLPTDHVIQKIVN
jgi:hypothetical protein